MNPHEIDASNLPLFCEYILPMSVPFLTDFRYSYFLPTSRKSSPVVGMIRSLLTCLNYQNQCNLPYSNESYSAKRLTIPAEFHSHFLGVDDFCVANNSKQIAIFVLYFPSLSSFFRFCHRYWLFGCCKKFLRSQRCKENANESQWNNGGMDFYVLIILTTYVLLRYCILFHTKKSFLGTFTQSAKYIARFLLPFLIPLMGFCDFSRGFKPGPFSMYVDCSHAKRFLHCNSWYFEKLFWDLKLRKLRNRSKSRE